MLSALLCGLSVAILIRFVLGRVPDGPWRLPVAVSAGALLASNVLVLEIGTLGQAYALGLLLSVVALTAVVRAVSGPRASLWSGLSAGFAVQATLLLAPVWPIFLMWTVTRHQERLKHAAWFVGGSLLSLAPFAWLAVRAPRQILFDVFEYHLRYRWIAEGADIASNDRGVWMSWISSPQAILLIAFGAVGWLFIHGAFSVHDEREGARSATDFRLCGWLAAALCAYLALTRPTFPHYFVLVTPFLSVLAALGLGEIAARLPSGRPWVPVAAGIALFALPSARWVYGHRNSQSSFWPALEAAGLELARVTPPDESIYADPVFYFAARRMPPPGLENPFSVEFSERISPELAALLHTPTPAQVDAWLTSGYFRSAQLRVSDPRLNTLFPRVYSGRQRVDCRCYGESYLLWKPADKVPTGG
jgi:hypothetical protein